MKNLFILLFIIVVLLSCSSNSLKNTYNEPYCNELKSKMIEILQKQITNDSLLIVEETKLNDLRVKYGFNITKKNAKEYISLEENCYNYYKVKFDSVSYEKLKLELLKEYYDLDGDEEMNNYINKYKEYSNKREQLNNDHLKLSQKMRFNV